MIQRLRLEHPIHWVCRALRVSDSGYYGWVSRPLSGRAQEEARLELEIRAAHRRTRETCGALRLHHELVSHGIHAGICRIRRIRRKLGIRCKQKRGGEGHHGVHRDILQPPASAGQAGVPVSCSLRKEVPRRTGGSMTGLVSTVDITPQSAV